MQSSSRMHCERTKVHIYCLHLHGIRSFDTIRNNKMHSICIRAHTLYSINVWRCVSVFVNCLTEYYYNNNFNLKTEFKVSKFGVHTLHYTATFPEHYIPCEPKNLCARDRTGHIKYMRYERMSAGQLLCKFMHVSVAATVELPSAQTEKHTIAIICTMHIGQPQRMKMMWWWWWWW